MMMRLLREGRGLCLEDKNEGKKKRRMSMNPNVYLYYASGKW
jgi:hypothetical protein